MKYSNALALSLHAVKLVLKELASFHATGFYFVNTYPGGKEGLAIDFPEMFTENIFRGDGVNAEMMSKFFEMAANMFGSCVLVAKKYGSEELGSRMEAYQKTVKTVLQETFSKQGKIHYVTHGDAWYNNFLYRYLQQIYYKYYKIYKPNFAGLYILNSLIYY